MRAIQISSFGKPSDVLKLVDIPEPPAPASGAVLIGVEFAPIKDLAVIQDQRPG
jgi:NADPH:quinone reductase-like Zn-dependent oxidoreductase